MPIVLSLGIYMQSVYMYHIHLCPTLAYVPAAGPLVSGGQGGHPARPPQGWACLASARGVGEKQRRFGRVDWSPPYLILLELFIDLNSNMCAAYTRMEPPISLARGMGIIFRNESNDSN